MADVVCVGDLLIDFVPTATGTGLADAPGLREGTGRRSRQRRRGSRPSGGAEAFMGMVGDDPFGHFLADTLADAGVDVGPLRFTTKARTALAFVSLRADGEREFMFYRHPSADMMFTPDEVDDRCDRAPRRRSTSIRSASPASIRAPCSLFAADPGARRRAPDHLRCQPAPAALARRRGGPRRDPDRPGQAQVVKLSDDELEFMTGSREPAAVRRLWHDGLQLVTLSRGSAGSTWFTAGDQQDVSDLSVPAVDTTGAGDGFMAGLIAGCCADPDGRWAMPTSSTRSAGFANAVGALTTLERGAIPALPTRAAVERFLESR